MKIIILNDFAFVNGGAGQVALSSAIALAARGHEIILFTAVGPIDKNLLNVKNLNFINLDQYDILADPKRWRAIINGVWNLKSCKIFEKLLNSMDNKNTIIHVHSYAKAISSSCIRSAIKKKFKVLFHIHDYGIACPNMGFFHYPKQEICTRQPLSYQCLKTNCDSRSYLHKLWRCLRQLIQIRYGMLPTHLKHFIIVSKFSHKILKPFLSLNSNVYLVPNPIEAEKKYSIRVATKTNYIFIGRLSPEKNPVLLAKAANKLNLSVIFVGSGPCEQEIMKNCPHALITGWVDSTQVEDYMQQARCLVLTSACYETQGMVVPEAAARGIPAIIPDTCAAQESIVVNQSGILFKNNDSVSLEQALVKMQDNNVVERMGRIAYENFWKEKNNMDRYIENIEMIYKDILQL